MTRASVDELFAIIPVGVLHHPRLSSQDVRTYGVLAVMGYTGEQCSLSEIGRRCGGASVSTTRRSILALVAEEVVDRVLQTDSAGRTIANTYIVRQSTVSRAPSTSEGGTPSTSEGASLQDRSSGSDSDPAGQAGAATHERKPRARDPLFDLLQSEAEGIPLDAKLGEGDGSRIGTAAGKIRRFAPDNPVGAARTAIGHWESWFNGATMTAMAIAEHIGQLQRPKRGRADQALPRAADEVLAEMEEASG